MKNEATTVRNETSALRNLSILLFLASVALNVCFIVGCRSLHDTVYGNPCKFAPPPPVSENDKVELVRIAETLDIKTTGKTVSDLSSDIRYKLERSADVPNAFNATAFERMSKDLRVEEKEAMRAYHRFISDLQGKRVIVIEPEGK